MRTERPPSFKPGWSTGILVLLACLLALAGFGCTTASPAVNGPLTLPELSPAALDGRPLRVVATTSVIGDVVGQVGGEAIDLAVLIGPGIDPHSYQPTARDLTAVEGADVLFVNGWDLEQALVQDLARISRGVPLVPASAGIEPLTFGAEAGSDADHAGADPHVWFSVPNVMRWTQNAAAALGALDPGNAAHFERNAAAYLEQLGELDEYIRAQVAQVPPEKRILVTNHDSLGYFAAEYGFTVLGSVIPAMSTVAEPSAGDLTRLIEKMRAHGLCTVFTETTVSDSLGKTVASELAYCETVRVVPLMTGSLGPAGSGADSFITMMRLNVDALVEGLR